MRIWELMNGITNETENKNRICMVVITNGRWGIDIRICYN